MGNGHSRELPVQSDNIHLDEISVIADEDQHKIMEMLNENWQQHIEALVINDVSGMVHASEEYRERIAEQAHNLSNGRKEYIGEVTRARYRTDSLKYPKYNNHTNRYELVVEAEYTVYEPEARTYAIFREDDDFNRTMYDVVTYYDEADNTWKAENYKVAHFIITDSDSHEVYDF